MRSTFGKNSLQFNGTEPIILTLKISLVAMDALNPL